MEGRSLLHNMEGRPGEGLQWNENDRFASRSSARKQKHETLVLPCRLVALLPCALRCKVSAECDSQSLGIVWSDRATFSARRCSVSTIDSAPFSAQLQDR